MNKFFYLFPEGIYESKDEKPEKEHYQGETFHLNELYKEDLTQWLLSCVKYKFGEREEDKFLASIGFLGYDGPNGSGDDYCKNALNSGIKIDSERVRLSVDLKLFGNDVTTYAYFVPIEDKPKEETQEEIWISVFNNMNKDETLMEHGATIPMFTSVIEPIIETLKSKFHITRK